MIRPKLHLSEIYRTPPDKLNRSEYLRLDKNEQIEDIDKKLLMEILGKITPEFLSTYPLTYQLYEKLSKVYGIDQENIILSAGSDAAIRLVFDVFVDKGDEIILLDPTFAMYEVYGKLYGARIKKIIYDSNLSLSIDNIVNSINENTKLIAIANPNSPTGTIIEPEDILKILEKANKIGAAVLVDEAYYYYYKTTAADFIKDFDNLIVTRTFSKAFGMASIRLGFALAQSNTIDYLRKFRPMYEVNAFAILFGSAVLENMDLMERSVLKANEGKEYLTKEMKKLGLKTFKSYANFVLIEVGEKNSDPLARYMYERGILIKGGYPHIALKKCIRISLGDVPQMKCVVDSINKYFKNYITGAKHDIFQE